MAFNLKNLEQMPRSTTGNNFKYVTDDDRYTVSQAGYFDLSSVTLNNPGNATINCLCPNHSFVAIVSSDGDCLVKLADRTYQYFTADTIADVTASGYFAGKNYSFDADESIKVQCADGPYEVQLVGGAASVVNYPLETSTIPVAAGKYLSKLDTNIGDVAMLIVGDSTGNEDTEVFRLYADVIAAKYPAYTVNYYLWDDTAGDYEAAEVVQVGTGSNTLRLYNASVSGSPPEYLMGSKFANAVQNINQCDLVVINHGHNMATGTPDTKTENRRVSRFLGPVSQILRVHNGAGLIMFAQNPNRDSDVQSVMANAVYSCTSLLNADCADEFKLINELGKDPIYYNDDKHPSALGTQVKLRAFMYCHKRSNTHKAAASPLDFVKGNLVPNGDFLDVTGGVPDGFASVGTITQDATTYISGKGYSIKVAGNGSLIRYTATSAMLRQLRGSWVTMAVRQYVEEGQPSTSGRIALTSNVDTFNTTVQTATGQGGWRWNCMSFYLPNSTSYLFMTMYGDTANTGGEAYFDKVVLVGGRLPADSGV